MHLVAVTEDGQIERYGLNAVCTHLGCVVRLQPGHSTSESAQIMSVTAMQCDNSVVCALLCCCRLTRGVPGMLQVPWNVNENKFKCPCHGSQYNKEGKVVRGPAPLVRHSLLKCSPDSKASFRADRLRVPCVAVACIGAHRHQG